MKDEKRQSRIWFILHPPSFKRPPARGPILMRTLVTGATGFVGPYLAEALLAAGDEVLGLSLTHTWPSRWAHLQNAVPLVTCDLLKGTELDEVLARFRPERICHLAGYALAGRSYAEPDAAWAGNLTLTRRLFDSVARSGLRVRTLFISTGLVYGDCLPTGRRRMNRTSWRRSVPMPRARRRRICWPTRSRAIRGWTWCEHVLSITSDRGNRRIMRSPIFLGK